MVTATFALKKDLTLRGRKSYVAPRVSQSSPHLLQQEGAVARSLNKAILIGNVGADPEIRTTSNSNRVAQFNLATSRRWTSGSGEQQEKTEWHRIVVWDSARNAGGGLFGVIERYVKKGERIYVEGEIQYRSYEDKDGVTKYATEIRPDQVILLGSGGGGGDAAQSKDRAPARAAASSDYDDFQPPSLDGDDDLPF
jgi:single-strand DNA-binding protein